MGHARAIAVIGVGCRFPGSPDPQSLWENVLARRAQYRRFLDGRLPVDDYVHADDPDKVYSHRAAYLDGFAFDWQGHRIPRSTFEHTDVVHWLALDVALQAVTHADLDLTSGVRTRTGVIVGNSLTGEQSRASTTRLRWPLVQRALRAAIEEHGLAGPAAESLEKATRERFLSVFPSVDEDSLQGGLSNTIAGRICNYLDLNGGGYVVDGACSSSLLAVATGADRLISGDLDVAIVGGVDVSLDPMELVGFARAGALTRDDMRVYDAAANGFIPGEGAGFAVLKRLADARRDGDDVVAVLRGWGVSSDGRGAITAPSGLGQSRAITRAYRRADLTPDEVHFVEGHGTGTRAGDLAELKGLQIAFEELGGAETHCWGVTSLKSLVGHMKAAAGMGGFIKAVLAVNQRVVPPTAGIRRPNPVFAAECHNLFPLLHGAQHPTDAVLRAGVSAMGFGGINAHVLVESADPPDPTLQARSEPALLLASSQRTELLCLSAPSADALSAQVLELRDAARPLAVAELAGLARQTNQRWRAEHPVRAAFVVTHADDLLEATESLLEALLTLDEGLIEAPDGRWWLAQALADPVIGFVYPGQGSQYVGAAAVPLARFPWAEQMQNTLVDLADGYGEPHAEAWMANPSLPVERERLAAELMRTEVAQPSLCLTSAIYTRRLEELGVRPSMVGGHSLGELSALWAAGDGSLSTLFERALSRGQAMGRHAPEGAMASLRCAPDAAADLITGLVGIEICNRNTPDHTVVGGGTEGIEEVMQLAQQRGIPVRRLRVSRAFHTSQMQPAAAALADGPFAGAVVPELKCVLVSSVDGHALQPGTDLLAHAQRQLREPVDFTALTRRMATVCDVMLEVGSGRVLSGLINHTTGTTLCLPVETADDQGDLLNRALAHLSVWGVPLALEALYTGRELPEPVAFADRVFIDNPCERPMVSTHVPVPFEASGEASSLSGSVLKNYLAERGDFLIDVLTADLRSSEKGGPNKSVAPVPPPTLAPALSLPDLPLIVEAPAPSQVTSVQDQLIALLIEKTGFSAAAITPESRLLDELNLDSIKAGEVLFAAVQAVGVTGRVELTELANATVAEIATRLEAARSLGGEEASVEAPAFDHANQWIRRFRLDVRTQSRQALLAAPIRAGEVVVLHAGLGEPVLAELEHHARRVASCHWRAWSTGSDAGPMQAHGVVLLPPLLEASAAVTTVSGMLGSALLQVRDTLLVVVRGAPLGLRIDGAELEGCGVSSLLASLAAERPSLAITVLHLLAEPKSGAWIEPALQTGLRAHGFATLAVFPEDPEHLLVPELHIDSEGEGTPELGAADDLWLVTGGARGITLACALALVAQGARRFVLLGRTPLPEGRSHAIHQALAAFEEAGAQAQYVCCDLTDAAHVFEVVATLRANLGPIRHVVHGAGVNHAARFETTSTESALREVTVKVGGLHNLVSALDLGELRTLVGLSSVIGVCGMPGNAWYAFANEALDREVAALDAAHEHLHARTVGFSLWGETGMIERLTTTSTLKRMGVVPLSTEVGTAHFLGAYVPGCLARAVVTGSMGELPGWKAMLPTAPSSEAFGGRVQLAHPGVEAVVHIALSFEADAYLEDHDFDGSRLFPTVMGLQAMADAAALVLGGAAAQLSFEEVSLALPITVSEGAPTLLVVHAVVPSNDPGCAEVGLYLERSGYREPHFRARVRPGVPVAVQGPSVPADAATLPIEPQRDLYGDVLFQGPRFQRMGPVLELDADHIVLRVLTAPDMEPIRPGVRAPSLGSPYLRDLLLQAPAVPLAPDQLLPISIGSLHRFADVPENAVVHAQITQRDGDEIEAEVRLCDPEGRVVEHLIGYRARVVRRRPGRPVAADYLQPVTFNQRALEQAAAAAGQTWELPLPSVHLAREPELAEGPVETRHKAQSKLLAGLLRIRNPDGPAAVLSWSAAGKPLVTQKDGQRSAVHVSMSHDDQGLFLAALHTGPVGCDLERVSDRSFAEWQFLLGGRNAILFNRIFSIGGSMAEAGHRVWGAMEVATKLGVPGAPPLELLGFREGVAAFWVRDTALTIVTFLFRPLGAAPVIVAVGVERPLPTVKPTTRTISRSGATHEAR